MIEGNNFGLFFGVCKQRPQEGIRLGETYDSVSCVSSSCGLKLIC